jgi:outer membrane protein assembly factor BamB
VVGLAAADGKLLWRVPFAAVGNAVNLGTPIIDGSTVIFAGGTRGTKAVKIEKKGDEFVATELWSSTIGTHFSTMVLKDGKLYGMANSANLFCLDARDGKTVWTDTTRYTNFGSTLDAGSVILTLASDSGQLIAFKPGDKYEEIAKIKVADTAAYAHPVIAGNRVYVKDQTSLALLTIE